MTTETFWPTVLIVDDDPAATRYYRERFQEDVGVGVAVARSLREGKVLLDNQDIHIDALISDLYFEYPTDDPENGLFDGIDLMRYSEQVRPKVPVFALSFFAERSSHHQRARELKVNVRRWLPKTWLRGEDEDTLCTAVQRDLVASRLENDVQARKRLAAVGIELTEHVDMGVVSECIARMVWPMRTYLQDLGVEDLCVQTPIEVVCVRDADGTVLSSAPRLGLLLDGEGESVEESLTHLASIIATQKRDFDEEPERNIVGYARLVKDRLNSCVSRRESE